MGEFFEMQEEGLLSWDGEYIGPTPNFYKELPFKCHKCKRGFGKQNALDQHNRAKHNSKQVR